MTQPPTYTAPGTTVLMPVKKSRHGYMRTGIQVRLPRVTANDSWVVALRAAPPSTGAAHAASDRGSIRVSVLQGVAFLAALIALFALGMLSRLVVRRRRARGRPAVAGRSGDRVHFFGGRGAARVYGDRMRMAFDQKGSEALTVGVALALAVALGALIAG
ncbi:MAG: hypothetical protein JO321_15810 [Solirubrobacterales bacterium]|nr:hypothetical protein [Solirubrobacterales bacterium]